MAGMWNSGKTRVLPVFGWLRAHGEPGWPDTLLQLAGLPSARPCRSIQTVDLEQEREVPASARRLAWMLQNLDSLAPADGSRWQELRSRTSDRAAVEQAIVALERGERSRVRRTLV